MRIRPSGFMVLALAIAAPAVARGAVKLDDDDRKFLLLVEPIILDDEESTYKKLKDESDREEFQKIFWARRDPDIKTPVNEFREKYLADRAIAETKYAVVRDARPGWANHCGRIFILLGAPDRVDEDVMWAMEAGKRRPETWTYFDRPGVKMAGGKLEIALGDTCWGDKSIDQQLDRIAASKIVRPNLDYRIDGKGRLVKLVELLPKDSAVRALVAQPRQDFPIAAQPAYLKVSDGGTGLFGILRGDAASLTVADGGGTKTVSLSLGAKAVAEDGTEAGWIEQAVTAPVGADGFFLATFKMGLKPGKYTLNAGAVDTKGGRGSVASLPIDVPDLSQVEKAADGTTHPVASVSSLVLVRSFEELPSGAPADPGSAFAAFTLGTLRMTPHFGSTFRTTDEISVLYQVYGLALGPVAAGDPTAKPAAKGLAGLRILKDGKTPVVKAPWKQIQTAVDGDLVGPISLAAYAPGRYLIELRLMDKIANRELKQETWFEVVQ